jgi:AAA domain-containing protein
VNMDFARQLVGMGCPVFRIYRIDGELKQPTGWETTYGGHPAAVNLYRHGEGLGMVTGTIFDVLDWDPRNDPDKVGLDAMLAIMPRVYAIVDSPRGGRHYYIAPLGLAKKQSIFPGVDYQGGCLDGTGRGYVYLPPTERVGGTYTVLFAPEMTPDGDTSGRAIAEVVAGQRRATPPDAPRPTQDFGDERINRYGEAAILGALNDYAAAPAGGGDTAALTMICRLLELENAGVSMGWDTLWSAIEAHDLDRQARGASGQGGNRDSADWHRIWKQARKRVGEKAAEIKDLEPFTVGGKTAEEWMRPKDDGSAPTPSTTASADAPTQESTADLFEFLPLSDIRAEEIEWLWQGWIPRRGATVLYGEGGIGKSTYLAHLAGHITRGTAPGALYGQPGKVIVLATEDHYASVIVPRFQAAGVDMTMAGCLIMKDRGAGGLILPTHTDQLRRMIERLDAVSVFFDPMIGYMRPDLSSDKAQHVRQVIDPLNAMSQEIGVSFMCLHHINKVSGATTNQRLSGSHAWRDSARAAIAFSRNPDGEYIFGQPKNNYGPMKRPMRYEIEQRELEIGEKVFPTSEFVFREKVDIDINELFGGSGEGRGRGRPVSSATIAVVAAVVEAGEMTVEQVHQKFNLMNRDHIKQILSRAAGKGDLVALGGGHYSAPVTSV